MWADRPYLDGRRLRCSLRTYPATPAILIALNVRNRYRFIGVGQAGHARRTALAYALAETHRRGSLFIHLADGR